MIFTSNFITNLEITAEENFNVNLIKNFFISNIM